MNKKDNFICTSNIRGSFNFNRSYKIDQNSIIALNNFPFNYLTSHNNQFKSMKKES